MNPKIFLSFLFVFVYSGTFAQISPIINAYAYSQSVLQGTKRANTVDESGKEIIGITKNSPGYFFYIEQKRSDAFDIVSVWIKGKNYGVKTDEVLQTPVEMKYPDSTITLVPRSSNKIILITPGSEKLSLKRSSSYLRKIVAYSELVIVYKWKGKLWYCGIKKIKELRPLAAV